MSQGHNDKTRITINCQNAFIFTGGEAGISRSRSASPSTSQGPPGPPGTGQIRHGHRIHVCGTNGEVKSPPPPYSSLVNESWDEVRMENNSSKRTMPIDPSGFTTPPPQLPKSKQLNKASTSSAFSKAD